MSAVAEIGSPDAEQALGDLLSGWDGERAEIRYDEESGAWMFVCLHTTREGRAAGGTRMRVYPTPAEGLADAMRLSAAMTRKLAVAGLPLGGAKAVLAVPELLEGWARRRLLLRYDELVESLGGQFWTGPDMNTREGDFDLVRHAIKRDGPGGADTSPATAVGIVHGIRASARHALGSERLDGLTVLVQGVGGVGGHLAALLGEEGARVVVTDVDAERAREVAARLGAGTVEPERALSTPCDVLAPCAVGGILNERSIPGLRCRIVAGAANNQLAAAEDGERLRAAGVLYAPDYVINAGGALHGIGLQLLGWTGDELERRLEGIGETLTSIYREADTLGISTAEAAERLAAWRLTG